MPILEAQMLSWLHATRSPLLDTLFGLATWMGSLWLLGPLAMACVIVGGRSMWLLPVALFGSSLLAWGLKGVFARPRPALYEALTILPGDASLPSSHATQAAAFAMAAFLLVPARLRYRVGGVGILLVVVVGVSRLYLQVHWPSDVLVGTVLGGMVALGLHRWRG